MQRNASAVLSTFLISFTDNCRIECDVNDFSGSGEIETDEMEQVSCIQMASSNAKKILSDTFIPPGRLLCALRSDKPDSKG